MTDLQLTPLPLNKLEVMWQPPETPNGILTGYEVTVYNTKLNYTHTLSVGPSVLNITISANIGKKHFMILLMHNN